MVSSYSREFLSTMNLEGAQLFKLSFDKMCKRFGREFLDYLSCSWRVNSRSMTEVQFCSYNGIDISFLRRE
jgi:hypothetical protein